MNQYVNAKKGEFDKVIEFFQKEIATIRTGRANPKMFEAVFVEAYGTKSQLNTLASINVQDGLSMLVAPYDKSILKDIEKGIVAANLGVGVVNEGDKIRVTMPKMTEENRKELVKKLNEKQEAARISVRQVRDEIKGNIEDAAKDKEVAEDDKFRFLKELEEEVGKVNDNIKAIRDAKEKDIMTI